MKTIVITGGSDGLGKAIAERLSTSYTIYLLARSEEKLKKLSEEIGCKYYVCDVADHAEVQKKMNDIAKDAGGIDVLINNAGLWVQGPLEENSSEEIENMIAVNTTGLINATKAVVPFMKEKGSGAIIQMNSQAGFYKKKDRSVYTASKWAVTGFTKSLQVELEPFGIAVMGIYPGALAVSMTKEDQKTSRNDGVSLENVAKTVEFILSFDDNTTFPEIGIKQIGWDWS